MGFLLLNNKPALRNGKLVVGDDYGCCCEPQGPCCCRGDVPDCLVEINFPTTGFCGFDEPIRLLIQYDWDPGEPITGPAFGCNFSASILFVDGTIFFQSVSIWADFAGQPDCLAVEGDYFWAGTSTATPAGTGFFFSGNSACDLTNATINVQRMGDGYAFTISGAVNAGCQDCDGINGTYLVEPP